MKQFQNDLDGLSKRVNDTTPTKGGQQVKNIVDTLREFAMSKLDSRSIADGVDRIERMVSQQTSDSSDPDDTEHLGGSESSDPISKTTKREQSGTPMKAPVTQCKFMPSYSKYYSWNKILIIKIHIVI